MRIEIVPCHITRFENIVGHECHEFVVLKDGLQVYPTDPFKQTCCVPKAEAQDHADSTQQDSGMVNGCDRKESMATLIQFLEKEIEWCEANRGKWEQTEEFEEGFISGLRQAIDVLKKLA